MKKILIFGILFSVVITLAACDPSSTSDSDPVTLEVLNVEEREDTSSYSFLEDGYKYVVVDFKITNNTGDLLDISWLWFEAETETSVYDYPIGAPDDWNTVPEKDIKDGVTGEYSIVFAILEDETITAFTYNDLKNEVKVDVE